MPEAKSLKKRIDGWFNLFTGIGIKERDKKQNTRFETGIFLTQDELQSLMRSDGFAKKIIETVPYEMLREGWFVTGDTDNLIGKYFNKLNLKKTLFNLLKWERAFGGAILLMGLDDGGKLEDELKVSTLKNITFLKVYDRYQVDKLTKRVMDTESERFGLPEQYGITPIGGTQFWVHYTRVLEVSGEELPSKIRQQNKGWGDSVIQSSYTQLRNLGSVYSGTASIVEDFITSKLTMKGLAEMIAAGEEDLIIRRLDLMDISKHIINTILLDEDEKYEKDTSSIRGLADVIDKFTSALSTTSNMPMRILSGETQAGLNNKGEANTRDWYDHIKTRQEDKLEPILRILIDLALLSSESQLKGKVETDWEIIFKPLWQPTADEVATTRKTVAETDTMYIDSGVLDPAEVTVSRFGGDEYSAETTVDIEGREKPVEDPADGE